LFAGNYRQLVPGLGYHFFWGFRLTPQPTDVIGKMAGKLQKGKHNWRASSLKRGKSLPEGETPPVRVLSEKFKARRWQN